MSKRLRSGDEVVVIAGNDKGKKGKVLHIVVATSKAKGKKKKVSQPVRRRVIVEGINLRKKHMRRTEQHPQGQIISIERPIDISNVQPCDAKGNAVRLHMVVEDKQRKLVYREGDKEIVYRSISKAG
jgi:large subunit ribosomal protein L24